MRRYYKNYPNLNEHKRSWLADWLTRKLVKKGLKFKIIKSVDFDDLEKMPEYNAFMLDRDRSKIYCEGWYFRHEDMVGGKYRKIYQHLFDPKLNKEELAKQYLVKTEDQLNIAVHIRRGDYKEYLNGIYFYDDAVYIEKIRELIAALNKDCKLVIFSNDTALNEDLYHQHFKNVIVSRNNVITDHYLMSQCDYIIGPPSTFSMWASFMGDKPFYHIDDKEAPVDMNKFKICFA